MVTTRRRRDQGADRLRAQPGPRAQHGLARPRSARLQLPPVRHRLRARARPARAPRRAARRPRAGRRAATARRSRGHRRPRAALPGRADGAAARLVRVRRPAPAAASTATRSCARCAERGDPEQAVLPGGAPDELLPREFGHREGEFPVCEDVAARSIALPFFPEMTEAQVEQVAESLARACSARTDRRRPRCLASPSRRTPPSARSTTRSRSTGASGRTTSQQSRAHASMLAAQGIISAAERDELHAALDQVERELGEGSFPFADGDEDIHMAIERRVTELAGRVGGKLHTARSRNDQVATDVAMFVRAHARTAVERTRELAADARRPRRGAPRLADARLHPPAARPAGLPEPPPARVLLDADPRSRPVRRRWSSATAALPLGAGALAGVNFDTDRELVARELGFAAVAENSIDAVSNRDFVLDYLAAAATCATHLSRLGGRDRAVVERGVRLLRGRRRVGLGVLDHAPEEEPRRRRAAARQGAARGRPPGRAPRRAPRPAADLQQGHAGGQGAPVRRGRHGRAVPRRGRRDAVVDHASAATGWPPRPPTSCSRRPTSPTCSSGAACRSARPTASSPVSCAAAIDQGKPLSRAHARTSWPRQSPLLDDEFYALLRDGAWLETKRSQGGTSLPRVREQLERARAALG